MSPGRNGNLRPHAQWSRNRQPVAALLSIVLLGVIGLQSFLATSTASAQDSADSLRPLRFEGYPDAPRIAVVPRKDELFFYPCDQCHASMEPNPDIRALDAVHDSELRHGLGQIWCLSCHDLEQRNYLRTLLGELVDFNDAHAVCGGCHANRHKDWVFGAHGKRVANWQGERTLYNCTHCHDAHSPALEARAPQPPPPVRAGLEREVGSGHKTTPVWDPQQEPENK